MKNDTKQMLLELCLAAGTTGVGMKALRSRLGLTADAVGWHLRRLEVAGLVEKSSDSGQGCVWGVRGIRVVHDARRDALIQESFAARASLKALAMRKNRGRELQDYPVVRIVAAAHAPRPRASINSVWALAA